MLKRIALTAALLTTPTLAPAATVEDPDSPRFADGLRVLGVRGEVEVIRLDEYAALDAEPLYLARTPRREAVFREGEDACMSKIAVGVFVPCAGADVAAIPLCDGHHQGRFDRSKIALHEAPALWREAYGADHEYIARTQDALAYILEDRK